MYLERLQKRTHVSSAASSARTEGPSGAFVVSRTARAPDDIRAGNSETSPLLLQDDGVAWPKCDRNRARRFIWRQGGVTAWGSFARIHSRRRFPSWTPRFIHAPKVPLHNTVGFLHRLGEIPSRRPVLEKRQRSYQRFCRRSFFATRQNPIGMQKPYRIVHGIGLRRTRCRMAWEKGRRFVPSTLIRAHFCSISLDRGLWIFNTIRKTKCLERKTPPQAISRRAEPEGMFLESRDALSQGIALCATSRTAYRPPRVPHAKKAPVGPSSCAGLSERRMIYGS